MTKDELIARMAEMSGDAPVYLSTGSSMDDRTGELYEVESVCSEFKTFGLALPKDRQKTEECIVLESC